MDNRYRAGFTTDSQFTIVIFSDPSTVILRPRQDCRGSRSQAANLADSRTPLPSADSGAALSDSPSNYPCESLVRHCVDGFDGDGDANA